MYHAENEGWLFSGDLYVGEKIRFFRVDERIGEQIDSLKKIVEVDFDAIFCAHRPMMNTGRNLLKRKLDYLVSMNLQILDLHQRGLDKTEIIQRLQVKTDVPVRLFTMGNASFSHMVRSSLNSVADVFQRSGQR